MYIWRARYEENDVGSGVTQIFATSERNIRQVQAEIKKLRSQIGEEMHVYSVERMEVPTKHNDLCRWLTIYCSAG